VVPYLIGAFLRDLHIILPDLVDKALPCHWASQFAAVLKSTWKRK